jgi:hypothetical protein
VEAGNTYRILVGKSLQRRLLVSLRKWENNIKMDLWEIDCEIGR